MPKRRFAPYIFLPLKKFLDFFANFAEGALGARAARANAQTAKFGVKNGSAAAQIATQISAQIAAQDGAKTRTATKSTLIRRAFRRLPTTRSGGKVCLQNFAE